MGNDVATLPALARTRSARARLELWGLADQAIASGASFVTLILLARVLGPTEFGVFVLAFTLLQLATLLQTALVTRPHNVLGATRRGESYRSYTRTVAAVQLLFAAALAVLVAVGSGAALLAGVSHASVFLAAAPALVGWQLQELGRRVLYTEDRLPAALANSLLTYGGQIGALVVLWRVERLTAESALLALAVATSLGAVVAAAQLRSSLRGRFDRSSVRLNWAFGRWLVAADVGYWLSSNFYFYLAAVVLGPSASAVLKVAQTLLGPVSVYQGFYLSYLPIRFARALGERDDGHLGRNVTRALAKAAPVTLVYALLVGVFAQAALTHVYGDGYSDETTTVRAFAVYYVLLSFSLVLVSAVSATRRTKEIFVAHAAGALVSLAVGWPLLEAFGPSGAVVGMIFSWTASTVLLWRAYRLPRRTGHAIRSVEPVAPVKGA